MPDFERSEQLDRAIDVMLAGVRGQGLATRQSQRSLEGLLEIAESVAESAGPDPF